ncbi:uncharacterized protein BP5553_04967 [Venustampulla echinocandica]|uniref:RBR-type E3 ubiquitin transferase n=1 Tax=Venustampulla echinocandica TaxID=2656787 RepID=A0A370TPU1_9HELO|nr:uncharacterized protein BP5553_04967 [Venustampulla echinocandica]RDL37534.1 hypothetical protein BP5553_04967 [Venustampulla echinocandica]
MDLSGIDDQTAALIIQFQLEDSRLLAEEHGGKGKAREGSISDSQLAFQLFAKDLKCKATLVADTHMAKSIARACQTDGGALATAQSQEHSAIVDRQMACHLGGVTVRTPVDAGTFNAESLDDELIDKLEAHYGARPTENLDHEGDSIMAYADSQPGDTPESSAWAAGRPPIVTYRQCIVCGEDVQFFDVVRVPCGHEYCCGCLHQLFKASLTDDSLFPPRCCRQPVASSILRVFLPADLLYQYEEKKIEHETPNRTYCSNASCSAFIKAENIADERASCRVCSCITCTICKAKAHRGDCPADTTLQEMLLVADANGWKRCFGCRRLVELAHGCNHIT